MHQYQVPQFITTEGRLIGQVTVKQFLYLGGGALGIFVAYKLLRGWLFTPIAFFFAAFSLALAFWKPDGQPFARLVGHAFLFILKPRLYIWETQKKSPQSISSRLHPPIPPAQTRRHIPLSKITDLAWNLNIQDHRNEHAEEDHHFSHRMQA
ncbi:MAG: hypothetical protein G01um101466_717 [Parcubacteria group bacterium Gr01-1014_66]|nr:MAG: hypothetical protein G01um101466_717 [Parcubacteria group bacterium Gr01-1014_66]